MLSSDKARNRSHRQGEERTVITELRPEHAVLSVCQYARLSRVSLRLKREAKPRKEGAVGSLLSGQHVQKSYEQIVNNIIKKIYSNKNKNASRFLSMR